MTQIEKGGEGGRLHINYTLHTIVLNEFKLVWRCQMVKMEQIFGVVGKKGTKIVNEYSCVCVCV